MFGQFFNWIAAFFSSLFNGVIDWIVNVINGLLSGLGDILVSWILSLGLTIEIPSNIYDIIHDLFAGVGYILPIRYIIPIPLFMVSFYVAKLIFAIFQLIYQTIIRRTTIKL